MSQIFTDAAAWEEPPTEYTDITEPTAENILPQIPLSTDANFRGCTCLRSALPLARARSAPTQQNLYSPTEFRTEHSCWDILPQISQIYTEILAEKTPTDFTLSLQKNATQSHKR